MYRHTLRPSSAFPPASSPPLRPCPLTHAAKRYLTQSSCPVEGRGQASSWRDVCVGCRPRCPETPQRMCITAQKKRRISMNVGRRWLLQHDWYKTGVLHIFKSGRESFENKIINEILGSKREDRFSGHSFDLVHNTYSVSFSYLFRLNDFCFDPRNMHKMKLPQKWKEIAGCWECAVYVADLQSLRNLAHPLRNGQVWTIWVFNHDLMYPCPVPPLLKLCSRLSRSFLWKDKTKYWKRWYGGRLRENMVEISYCLDLVVEEGMSRVLRCLEVCNINGAHTYIYIYIYI